MLVNMQLLPLKTFLVSSGLRSILFLALCSGDLEVPNHPPAQPLAGGGAQSPAPQAALPARGQKCLWLHWAGSLSFRLGCSHMGILVSLLLGACEVGSLQGSCFPELSGGFEEPLLMDMGSWWLILQLGRIRGMCLGWKVVRICGCPTLEGMSS